MRSTKPPLELDVEIETADGSLFTWDATSRRSSKRPRAISFATQRGDGFAAGGCLLTRQVMRDYPDLNLLDTIRFVGKNGDVAYEGRNHDFSRTNDPIQQFAITTVGWMTTAQWRTLRMPYIDRDLSNWGEPSAQRRATMLTGGYRYEGQMSSGFQDAGAGGPGIFFTFRNFDGSSTELGEAFYYGGGADLAEARADFVVLVGGADSSWKDFLTLSPDDLISSPYDDWSSHGEAGATNQSVKATGSRKYVNFRTYYTGGFATDGNNVQGIANIRVFADSGLTIRGAQPNEGFYLSDLMQHIITNFTPLTWAGNTNTYIVQQANFQGVKPYDGIQQLNNMAMWETSVFEDKKFLFYPADLTTYDWQVRTDDPGVTFTPLQGDSIDDFANGVEVTYTDVFTGRTETLYPSDFPELQDTSDNNPATLHGDKLWTPFTCPNPTTRENALQIGRAYLAEYNRPKAPGTITIKGGYIKDAAGHWQQGWKPRNSQTIALTNHPNDAPRLITNTTWDQDSKTLVISVDNAAQLLEAFIARWANARQAAGLS